MASTGDPWSGRAVRLLASVADLEEVATACALGADLIDLKDPVRGSLGAWPLALMPKAVEQVAGRCPVSATIGDLPMEPGLLVDAVHTIAATGVDLVKAGFFQGGDHARCAEALGAVARSGGIRLVAVLMADQRSEPGFLLTLARAGFYGVMLDTADKAAGGLRVHRCDAALSQIVRRARSLGLLTGLAGSLSVADIPFLAALGPDYLGFRGALCRGGRAGPLDPGAFQEVRAALDRAVARNAA